MDNQPIMVQRIYTSSPDNTFCLPCTGKIIGIYYLNELLRNGSLHLPTYAYKTLTSTDLDSYPFRDCDQCGTRCYTQVERSTCVHNLWIVTANIETRIDQVPDWRREWSSTFQVPTFLLDGDVLGIVTEHQAIDRATDMLKKLLSVKTDPRTECVVHVSVARYGGI